MTETTRQEGAAPQKHTGSSIDDQLTTLQSRILGAMTHGARTESEMHRFVCTHGPECARTTCKTTIRTLLDADYLVKSTDATTAAQTYEVTDTGLAALADSLGMLVDHVLDLRLVDAEAYGAIMARIEELEGHSDRAVAGGDA